MSCAPSSLDILLLTKRPLRSRGADVCERASTVFLVLSVRHGMICAMPRRTPRTAPLLSATGIPLTRGIAFDYALDPTAEQVRRFGMYAGAARFTFNHHLTRVQANLDQRAAERSYGLPDNELTPSLSWSEFSFIGEMNSWKNGTAPDSPVAGDGTRGLGWRTQVPAVVFETASVDASLALKTFASSRAGTRRGRPAAFPRFKSKKKSIRSFRLRNYNPPAKSSRIRPAGPKKLRLPAVGDVRVHGNTRMLRRMLDAGRLHLYTATIKFVRGRWHAIINGYAAEFHHQRRSSSGRHLRPAGLDRGVKNLAVIADDEGHALHVVEGVKALQRAKTALRRADKALSRAKTGSAGRSKAKARCAKLHARVVHKRLEAAHKLTWWAAANLTRLTIEDLNVAGLGRFRSLARAIADASLGDLGRLLAYKSRWYGCELIIADRWYPSSKTCSSCGTTKSALKLSDRTYRCDECGLEMDRDLNAAVNLARWPDRHTTQSPQPAAA